MLRIVRITLLALVPMLAIGALASACSDDTTNTAADLSVVDMTATVHDMAMHDLAPGHD
ncbi:MAG TPA: hypothetical protein VHB97_03860 [Polyangia bacterium]|nr:hypothetical protein [Polyangia bacterium]